MGRNRSGSFFGSFKDRIIQVLKNIVENAEREKEMAQQALAQPDTVKCQQEISKLEAEAPTKLDLSKIIQIEPDQFIDEEKTLIELISADTTHVESIFIEQPLTVDSKDNNSSLHSLLHQGKDTLSTRFLAGSATPEVPLPASKDNLVDPSFARAQLDSSWHHIDDIKAQVEKDLATKAKAEKIESTRKTDFSRPSISTPIFVEEDEPTLLAAQWQCTPDDTLMGKSPTEESFKRAAENIATSPATLAWLSSLVSPEVRTTVAANEKTPPETLRKLANDVDNTVRLSVASNPHTPSDVLRTLTRDVSKLTASEAQSALNSRGDVVEAERKSQNLLSNNRFNPTSNHLVASYTTLDAVMPDGINDGSKADSEWQSLNNDGARKAYKQQKDTVKDLKFNHTAMPPSLSKDRMPHSAFDQPPENASPQEAAAFLKMIATRLSTPPSKLAELALNESLEVRAAVAENINTPAEAFMQLAKDSQAQVKLRVIDNSNCPTTVLEFLKDDQDPYVGYEAKNQLKRLQNAMALERSAIHQSQMEGLM